MEKEFVYFEVNSLRDNICWYGRDIDDILVVSMGEPHGIQIHEQE